MKKKHLIIKHIALIFLISAVIAVIFGYLCIDMVYNRLVTTYTHKITDNAIDLCNIYLDAEEVEEFLNNGTQNDKYDELREDMKYICEISGLKYMYIFVPFQNNKGKYTYKYFITVASDDEEDKIVKAERSLGMISDDICTEQEMKVFRGELENCCYIFSNQYGEVYTWVQPFKNDSGEITSLICADFDNTSIRDSISRNSLIWLIIMTIIILTLLVLLLVYLTKSVFIPIEKISQRMSVYDPDKLFCADEIKSSGEIKEIAVSFEKMSLDMSKYIENNRNMTEEQARSAAELDTARKIQSGIVPERSEINEKLFTAKGYAKSSKEVGGDFYDCFRSGSRIYLIIGDVSGKGIAAALFMAMTKNMLHEKLCSNLSPAQALNTTNDEICMQNPEGMFVTAFVAVIDTDTGEMVYANAGHLPPVLISDKSRFLETESGMALGLFEDADICNQVTVLLDNEGLLLYTDGITEAVSHERKFFGADRLLEKASEKNSDAFSIAEEIHNFEKDTEQFDDITLLSLHINEQNRRILKFPCDTDLVDELKENVMEMIFKSENKIKIMLACEEIFVNIAEYSGAEEIEIVLSLVDDKFIVRFSDSGKEFDPSANNSEKEFEELDSGGMGINIAVQTAEKFCYNRIDGRNILKMIFTI